VDGRVIGGDVGVVDRAGKNWRLIDMPISMHSRLKSSMCLTDDFFESGYTTLLGDGDPSNTRKDVVVGVIKDHVGWATVRFYEYSKPPCDVPQGIIRRSYLSVRTTTLSLVFKIPAQMPRRSRTIHYSYNNVLKFQKPLSYMRKKAWENSIREQSIQAGHSRK